MNSFFETQKQPPIGALGKKKLQEKHNNIFSRLLTVKSYPQKTRRCKNTIIADF